MQNDNVMEPLKTPSNGEEHPKKDESLEIEKLKYLIFKIADRTFGLPAKLVKEIIISNDIYKIPFVPPYIMGLINRHGDPYTVYDINMLLENEELKGSRFIIFNPRVLEDHMAFLISDVAEFIMLSEQDIKNITYDENEYQYFSGSFELNKEEVFLLDVDRIRDRLQFDL